MQASLVQEHFPTEKSVHINLVSDRNDQCGRQLGTTIRLEALALLASKFSQFTNMACLVAGGQAYLEKAKEQISAASMDCSFKTILRNHVFR